MQREEKENSSFPCVENWYTEEKPQIKQTLWGVLPAKLPCEKTWRQKQEAKLAVVKELLAPIHLDCKEKQELKENDKFLIYSTTVTRPDEAGRKHTHSLCSHEENTFSITKLWFNRYYWQRPASECQNLNIIIILLFYWTVLINARLIIYLILDSLFLISVTTCKILWLLTFWGW